MTNSISTETKQIQYQVLIEKADLADFDARFVMSAGSPDRVNDTIEPDAYKSAEKQRKLIALWQHKADQPIGFWSNLKAEGDRLLGYLKISNTNLGQMIKQLIADGVPLGASIGFRGAGEPNKKGGIHFKTIELMECSVVSIPAHPRAMQIAKQFSLEEFVEGGPSVQGDEQPASGPNADEIIGKAKSAILAANRNLRFKGSRQ